MANFYLDTNGTSELGQSSSPVRVNGTAGDKDRILLLSNAANVTVGPAVEIIDFAGSVADYTFVQGAGGIDVYRGDTLVASLASNPDTSELRFAEGGLTLEQTAEGPFALGGQEITAEKAEYAGNGMLTGEEHQSQAGTNGPAGKGQDYFLPADYLPGNIIRSDNLSNTYTTEMNGLVSRAQIIDASTEDDDVLVLNYNARNLNGAISNVETIQAKWDGLVDGEFDAKQVSHYRQGGTNIVVSNLRSVATGFVVDDVRGNSVTAGDGVTGVLSVRGIKGGGTIDVNDNGAGLELGGSGNTLVTATKGFSLKFGAGAEDFTTSRSKVLTIRSDNDITVTGSLGKDGNGAHIQAAGNGKIVLGTGLAGAADSSDDIANMKGFAAIGVGAGAAGAQYIVSKGQTVFFADGESDHGATFKTDGREYNVALGMWAGERRLGELSIYDGHSNDAPNQNEVSRLVVDTHGHPLTIENLRSDGVGFDEKGAQEAGADTFAFTGADSVTVRRVDNGGVIDAAQLGGKLTVGSAAGAVDVGDAHHALAIATGKGGGEAFIGSVGHGLFFYQGQNASGAAAGADDDASGYKDTVHFAGAIQGTSAVNTGAIVHLGAGDDTVVFEKGSSMHAKVDLDFGDGGRDTLEVKDGAGKDGVLQYNGSIKGVDVMKIDTKNGQKFVVSSSALGSAPAFELQSDGLVITHDRGTTDLSGITAEKDGVRPTVTVLVTQGNDRPAGTVVCTGALSEVIQISGHAARPEDRVVIKGFVGGSSSDKIEFVSSDRVGEELTISTTTSGGLTVVTATDTSKNVVGVVYLEGNYTETILKNSVADKIAEPATDPGAQPSAPTKDYVDKHVDTTTGVLKIDAGVDATVTLEKPMKTDSPNTGVVLVDGSEAHSIKGTVKGIEAGGSLVVLGSSGDDEQSVTNEVEGSLTANLGDGDDTLILENGFASGAATVLKLDGGGHVKGDTLVLKKGLDMTKLDSGDEIRNFEILDLDGQTLSGATAVNFNAADATITGVTTLKNVKASTIDASVAPSGATVVDLGGLNTLDNSTLTVSGATMDVSMKDVVLKGDSGSSLTVSGSTAGAITVQLASGDSFGDKSSLTVSGAATAANDKVTGGSIGDNAVLTLSLSSGADTVSFGSIGKGFSGSINTSGDAADDTVTLGAIGDDAMLSVNVGNAGASGNTVSIASGSGIGKFASITVNGGSGSGASSNKVTIGDIDERAKNLSVTLGNGADTVTIGNIGDKAEKLTVDVGSGNNTVTIGDIGADLVGKGTISGGDGNDIVKLGTIGEKSHVEVTLGNGANEMTVKSLAANAELAVSGGSGVDKVTVDGTIAAGATLSFTSGGASASGGQDSVTFKGDILAGGVATLVFGPDSDSVTFTNTTLSGTLNITGGAGGLTVNGGAVAAGGELKVSGSNTGDAVDAVTLGRVDGTVSLTALGSGDDVLTTGAIGSGADVTFSGGSGDDTVTLGTIEKGATLKLAAEDNGGTLKLAGQALDLDKDLGAGSAIMGFTTLDLTNGTELTFKQSSLTGFNAVSGGTLNVTQTDVINWGTVAFSDNAVVNITASGTNNITLASGGSKDTITLDLQSITITDLKTSDGDRLDVSNLVEHFESTFVTSNQSGSDTAAKAVVAAVAANAVAANGFLAVWWQTTSAKYISFGQVNSAGTDFEGSSYTITVAGTSTDVAGDNFAGIITGNELA